VSGCCATLAGQFDADRVARERAAREKRGPGRTTAKLIDLLGSDVVADVPIDGATLLDIGAGFGDIQTALFPRGLASSTHVEASEAYSAAARELAGREAWAERARYVVGDFVQASDELPEADIVTLDRTVCCYPDMPGLLDRSAERARALYAISAPRDAWFVRAAIGLENLTRRLRKDPFRTFIHSWKAMDDRLRGLGLMRVAESGTIVWRIALYRRCARQVAPARTGVD